MTRSVHRSTQRHSNVRSVPSVSPVLIICALTSVLTRTRGLLFALSAGKHLRASMTAKDTKAFIQERKNLSVAGNLHGEVNGDAAVVLLVQTLLGAILGPKQAGSVSNHCSTKKLMSATVY